MEQQAVVENIAKHLSIIKNSKKPSLNINQDVVKGERTPNDHQYVMDVQITKIDEERVAGVNAAYDYILKKQKIAMFPGVVAGMFLLAGIVLGYVLKTVTM